MLKSNISKIIIAVVVVLLALIGVYIYSKRGDTTKPPSNTGFAPVSKQATTTVSSDADEFLRTLQNLKGLKLDGTILKEPAFTTLFDFGVPLQDPPRGRNNPFSPISGGESYFVRQNPRIPTANISPDPDAELNPGSTTVPSTITPAPTSTPTSTKPKK